MDGAPPADRDVVVYPKGREPQNISILSANTDPMVYPLLFPRGELGWHPQTLHNAQYRSQVRNKTTLLQYYSYRLAVRDTFSPIFFTGKLFQQYIVDAYTKTEADRIA